MKYLLSVKQQKQFMKYFFVISVASWNEAEPNFSQAQLEMFRSWRLNFNLMIMNKSRQNLKYLLYLLQKIILDISFNLRDSLYEISSLIFLDFHLMI